MFLASEGLSEHAIAAVRRALKAGGFLSAADVAKFAVLDLAHQALEHDYQEATQCQSPT
jgi:Arc/MetJ-type ribon-helix-helix transcriptional regulator